MAKEEKKKLHAFELALAEIVLTEKLKVVNGFQFSYLWHITTAARPGAEGRVLQWSCHK